MAGKFKEREGNARKARKVKTWKERKGNKMRGKGRKAKKKQGK